ncbi:MAG TPA: hypothetical protein VFV57_06055 [Limnobacter sp.]|nr:hypothetical protein [Limnobacter sp.]
MTTDLNALQRAAAFHIQRGDSMTMDPAVVLGLANAVQYAINALKAINTDQAREAVDFLTGDDNGQ